MNKKDLKMYEAPACDVVELKMSQILCGSTNDENYPVEDPVID